MVARLKMKYGLKLKTGITARLFPAYLFLVGVFLVWTASPATAQGLQRGVGGTLSGDLSLINDIEDGFLPLFNGKNLDGWEQRNGTATFEVVRGTIQGRATVGGPSSFLCTLERYGDFDLRFSVKVDEGFKSGIQIRSLSKPGFKEGRVHGPKVEIESESGLAGYLYSEGTGRGWVSTERKKRDVFKNNDWNQYRILARGTRIQTWVNGTQIEDIEMPGIEPRKGFIGLQVHEIGKNQQGPFTVQWQNIRIQELEALEKKESK